MDQDPLSQLYDVADDDELEMLNRLRQRAGLIWTHPGCRHNNPSDTNKCEACGQPRPRPTAELRATRTLTLVADTAEWSAARRTSAEEAPADFERWVDGWLPLVGRAVPGYLVRAEVIAQPERPQNTPAAGTVHLVHRDTIDGLYLFADQDMATAYAALHPGAEQAPGRLLDRNAAATLLAKAAAETATDS